MHLTRALGSRLGFLGWVLGTWALALPALPAVHAQSPYFPPATGEWESLSLEELGWCPEAVTELTDYAAEHGTRALIVLQGGRMALELYLNGHGPDSLWYWASAGKSLTSFVVGQAQAEGFIDLDAPSSTYLGTGWSSLTPEQESAITVRHHLTMTTGLDDGVADDDCTLPGCLAYLAEPGTRWAYHNAPYTLLHTMLPNAIGTSLQAYMLTRLYQPIGMLGAFYPLGSPYNETFVSKARDMARFGLLVAADGVWNGQDLLENPTYFADMLAPSSEMNPAYGYLWWLNGSDFHRLPQTQWPFAGPLIPPAPADLKCALGKNDQKIYVSDSLDWVVVRLGESAGLSQLALSSFDSGIWERLMALPCDPDLGASEEPAPLETQGPCGARRAYPVATMHLPGLEVTTPWTAFDAGGRWLAAGVGPSDWTNVGGLSGSPLWYLRTDAGCVYRLHSTP